MADAALEQFQSKIDANFEPSSGTKAQEISDVNFSQ